MSQRLLSTHCFMNWGVVRSLGLGWATTLLPVLALPLRIHMCTQVNDWFLYCSITINTASQCYSLISTSRT